MSSVDAPSATRSDRRRSDTRQRLIEAALKLFAEKGYASTSVAEIEKAVGLRPGGGGLYRHFVSKDELLVAAVSEYGERVRALRRTLANQAQVDEALGEVEDSVREKRLRAELRHLVDSLARFVAGERSVVHLATDPSTFPEAARLAMGEAWDEGYAMAGDVFMRHGVPNSAARVLAIGAIGSLDHYFSHVGHWHKEPAGVGAGDFFRWWVATWSQLAMGHISRYPSSEPKTETKQTISPG